MNVLTVQFYEFGPFRLDPARHLLLRDEKVVPLTPKAFETLALLVRNCGQIVEKDELMTRVWPDTFVEEGSLARNISVLRKTLGENPSDHQYIETVPKRGYRFVASVREVQETNADAAEERRVGEDVTVISDKSAESGEGALVASYNNGEATIAHRDELSTRNGEVNAATPIESSVNGTLNKRLSNVEQPAGQIKRRQIGSTLILTMFVVAALTGLAYGVHHLSSRSNPASSIETMKVMRFTNTGKSTDAAISSDGKFVVYVVDDAGQQSLWVKQVATAGNVQIVSPADVSYQGLAFSPDGNYVYYNVWDKKHVGVIYRVPALGGIPKTIIVDVMPSIAVSPDGERIAFIRSFGSKKESALMIANVDGAGERILATRDTSRVGWFKQPAWSPDGNVIACTAGSVGSQGVSYMQVIAMPAEGGPEVQITPQRWLGIYGLAWLKDSIGLVMTATDQSQSPLQLWHLSYPDGGARKITNDVSGYGGISLTADSTALVTVQRDVLSNIWVVPSGDTNQAKKITSGRYEGFGLSWTPSGEVVYVSGAKSGNPDIWIMDRDGKNNKQLTIDAGVDIQPSVSSDGRYVVFVSNRTGSFHIWRMDIDGGNQRQLTDGSNEWWPQCSPTNSWIVFISAAAGKGSLWKVSIDGGEPVQLTDTYSHMPAISPDGEQIAYSFWDEVATPEQWGREIIPFEGAGRRKPFAIPSTAIGSHGATLLRWTPDGRALTYVDHRDGVANVWSLPLDGHRPERLTDFKEDQIFWFDWSRDGGHLACARGVATSDVVLIRDFK